MKTRLTVLVLFASLLLSAKEGSVERGLGRAGRGMDTAASSTASTFRRAVSKTTETARDTAGATRNGTRKAVSKTGQGFKGAVEATKRAAR